MAPSNRAVLPIIALALAIMVLTGCASSPTGAVIDHAKDIKATSEKIDARADHIIALTTDGKNAAPSASQWDSIKSDATEIKLLSDELDAQAVQVSTAQAECAKWEKKAKAAEQAARDAQNRVWVLCLIFGAAALVAAIPVGIWLSIKLASALAATGASAIALGKFMLDLPPWLVPVLWCLLILGIVAGVAYVIWAHRKEIAGHLRTINDMARTLGNDAGEIVTPTTEGSTK